jgi:hypothetical protein
MNKRILELAELASVEYIASEQWVFTNEELVRFAESIVQECVDVIMEGDRTRRDYFADKVKKHFGVK